MIKYAVPTELITDLIDLKICVTEDEAREKVASGEAPDLIKEAKLKLLAAEGFLTDIVRDSDGKQ